MNELKVEIEKCFSLLFVAGVRSDVTLQFHFKELI